MYKKAYKIICIIITVFVCLFCVHFDFNEAQASLLPYASDGFWETDFNSDNYILTDTPACTNEMLGVRAVRNINRFASRGVRLKEKIQFSIAWICPDCCFLSGQASIFVLFYKTSYISCVDEQIVTYIHNSDGKKRI